MAWVRCIIALGLVALTLNVWAQGGVADPGSGSEWKCDAGFLVAAVKEMAETSGVARESGVRYVHEDHWIEGLGRGEIELAWISHELTDAEQIFLALKYSHGTRCPETHDIGNVVASVLTSAESSVDKLTMGQLYQLLTARGRTGKVYLLKVPACEQLIRRVCLSRRESNYTTIAQLGHGVSHCDTEDELLGKVKADSRSIGVLLFRGKAYSGVKEVRLVVEGVPSACVPFQNGRFNWAYPLRQPVRLFASRKCSEEGRSVAAFVLSADGLRIAENHGIVTGLLEQRLQGEYRLSQMKAGKGTPVSFIGLDVPGSAVEDLALRYVQAKAVMQLTYAPAYTDVPALGEFITGSKGIRELMLLGGKPSERALEAHGAKWTELNPAEYLIAGRAVGIVGNAANGTDWLTVEQIKGIFAGGIADWGALPAARAEADAASRPTAGKAASGSTKLTASKINCYALKDAEPAAGLFARECLPSAKFGRVTLKKDSNDVIAAVGMDPQGIGFVDLAACSNRPLGAIRFR